MERIDFEGNEDSTVVVRTRYGIAVYENPNGDVVIRQDGGMEDDAIVVVQRQDVEALILALKNEIG